MVYTDILQIPSLEKLKLVAGKKGLYRSIRWIYFADCIECLDEAENISDWIHGGELIIVTHKSITQNTQKLRHFMEIANKKDAAGFIVHVGGISPEIMTEANKLNMPLFELSLSIKLVDLSQTICKLLVEEENKDTNINRIFTDLLAEDNINNKELLIKAGNYGLNLKKNFTVLIFSVQEKKVQDDKLQKIIVYELRKRHYFHAVVVKRNDNIVAIVPMDEIKTPIKNLVEEIRKDFYEIHNLKFIAGISSIYSSLQNFKAAYEQAMQAMKIASFSGENIVCHEEMGIYSILFEINNKAVIEHYYQEKLGDLLAFDVDHNKTLCETLDLYLQHDCKLNETAKELFIHRNTLRYRLDKIESILNKSLDKLSNCLELKFAFQAKSFCDNT